MAKTPSALAKPASTRFITLTLLLGLMLNLLPWEGPALLVRPDFLLLLLLYWAVHQPLRVGMAAAWGLGLAMDVADGALLGQFALAYTVAVYVTLALNRRIRAFDLWQQAVHIAMPLAISQILVLLVHLLTGSRFIGWAYFLPTLVGTLLWPPASLLVQIAQRTKAQPDITYSPTRSGDK